MCVQGHQGFAEPEQLHVKLNSEHSRHLYNSDCCLHAARGTMRIRIPTSNFESVCVTLVADVQITVFVCLSG